MSRTALASKKSFREKSSKMRRKLIQRSTESNFFYFYWVSNTPLFFSGLKLKDKDLHQPSNTRNSATQTTLFNQRIPLSYAYFFPFQNLDQTQIRTQHKTKRHSLSHIHSSVQYRPTLHSNHQR